MICPKCKEKLVNVGRSFVCTHRHNFDIAKQGYVNLMMTSSKVSGDSKEMVVARHHFLHRGYYEKLQAQCVELVKKYNPHTLVDLGCGEGYYTQAMSAYVDECIGIDLSKDALKIASREDKNSQYVLASIFHLPIQDNSVDMITNIFAPMPLKECRRVLKDKGYYLRVTPYISHLYEFKQILYKDAYENEIGILDEKDFVLLEEILVEDKITLKSNEDIQALFMMTPYYWKSSKETSKKVEEMTSLTTTASFEIQLYQYMNK